MEELTPRQRLERHLEKLEDVARRVEEGLTDLQRDIERLRTQCPPLTPVMVVEVDGARWFCDGYMAIRDAWPGDYEFITQQPNLAFLLAQWEAVTTPVRSVELAGDTYRHLGRLIEKRKSDAERKAEKRGTRSGSSGVRGTSGGQLPDGAGKPTYTNHDQHEPTNLEGDAHARATAPPPVGAAEASVLEESFEMAGHDGVAGMGPSLSCGRPLPKRGPVPWGHEDLRRLKEGMPPGHGRLDPVDAMLNIEHEIKELMGFGDLKPGTFARWREREPHEQIGAAIWGLAKANDDGVAVIKRFRHAARLIGNFLNSGADSPEGTEIGTPPSKVTQIRQGRAADGRTSAEVGQSWLEKRRRAGL